MLVNKLILEKIESRNFNYLVFKSEIKEKIFNDEIMLSSISMSKDVIPDWISFFIAVTGTIGLDEFDMVNAKLDLINEELMLKDIQKFQEIWKLNLNVENLLRENIQKIYNVDMDPSRKNYDSEICFLIETDISFLYFFTKHLHY